MVRALLQGQDFLGNPTTPTRVVWLTEQSPASFRQVLRRAGLEGRRDLLLLFWYETRGTSWDKVAAAAVARSLAFGAGLLVVDTLPQFAGLSGDAENSAGEALRAIQPLQAGAGARLAVVLVRHERKGGGNVEDSARGSSALTGAVDIVLSLRRPEGAQRPTIRVIHGLSRFDETPAELLVELDGDTYIPLGSAHDVAAQEARTALLAECPTDEGEAISLKNLLERLTKLKRTTAQEALTHLQDNGLVRRVGQGGKRDPFRYYRPVDSLCRNSLSGETTPAESTDPPEFIVPEPPRVPAEPAIAQGPDGYWRPGGSRDA